jgi:hypothetical protein
MRWPALLFLPLGLLGAMSCNGTQNGTLQLIFGQDDPFSESDAAAPTSISIAASVLDPDGGSPLDGGWSPSMTLVDHSPYPVSTLNLPQQSTDDVDSFQVTLYDSTNDPIIYGQTIAVPLGGISGLTDLPIFVQRTGQFARLPSPFPAPPPSPLAALFEGRFVLVADGSGKSQDAQIYDLLLWGLVESLDGGMGSLALPSPPITMAPISGTTFMFLICAPKTMPAGVAGGLVSAGDDLYAVQVDISTISPPLQLIADGGTWQSIAGGQTIVSPNGDVFVVGATRPSTGLVPGATSAVLAFQTGQNLLIDAGVDGGVEVAVGYSWITLNNAREGAAAVWSNNKGLVVLGGNPADAGAGVYGIEYASPVDGGIPDSTTMFDPELQQPEPDPIQGAGATSIDTANGVTDILLAGGTLPDGGIAPVRLLQFGTSMADCGSSSDPDAGNDDGGESEAGDEGEADAGLDDGEAAEAGDGGLDASAPVGVPLVAAQGFLQPDASPMFIGTESDQTTHAFLVPLTPQTMCPLTPTEVPLRVPGRIGTTALLSPIPSVLVIGGANTSEGNTMESYIPAP